MHIIFFIKVSITASVACKMREIDKNLGLNIFYFLNKYDNISIHCNLQITGSERKQEYLYSSSPEHIKFVKFTGRILNFQ